MKKSFLSFQNLIIVVSFSILFSACSSSTLIHSQPSGAVVYIDNMRVGETPYLHTDSKISLSSTTLVLEKEGYEPLHTFFTKDEELNAGALVGGIFVWPVWLWAMKYYPERTYELLPLGYYDNLYYEENYIEEMRDTSPFIDQESKFKLLRELKKLLDEGILTDEEYQREKSRILNEGDK